MQASTIVLIVNILCLVVLAVGLLFGLRRGLKRSGLHLLLIFLGLFVSIFITKPITMMFLGIDIVSVDGEMMTLSDLILSLFGGLDESSATLTEFTKSLPVAIASPIVYIIVALIVSLVFEIIYFIIAKICFKSKKQENELGVKRHRILGGLVGTVEAFLFTVMLLMPLSSLSETFSEIIGSPSEQEAVIEEEDGGTKLTKIGDMVRSSIPQFVIDFVDAYNGSVIGVVSGMGGLDHIVFNSLSSVEINNEKISPRSELLTFTHTYDEIVDIYNNAASDYDSIDFDVVEEVVDSFTNSKIYTSVICPILSEFIDDYENVLQKINVAQETKEKLTALFSNLQTRFNDGQNTMQDYIKTNITELIDVARTLSNVQLINNIIDGELASSELLSATNVTALQTAGDTLINLPLLEDAYDFVEPYLLSVVESFESILDTSYFSGYTNCKSEIVGLLDIMVDLANIDASENAEQSTNLLQAIISGSDNYANKLVQSDNAVEIVDKITSINCTNKMLAMMFEKLDQAVIDAIRSVDENVSIADEKFQRTITSDATSEKREEFSLCVNEQAQDLVDVAKLALDENFDMTDLENVGFLIDKLKLNVANGLDYQSLTSNGIFTQIFSNFYRFFSGTITEDNSNNPAFAYSDEFNNIVNEKYAEFLVQNPSYVDYNSMLKYYVVSYQEVFSDLQQVIELLTAYEKYESIITSLLSNITESNHDETLSSITSNIESFVNDVGLERFESVANKTIIANDGGITVTTDETAITILKEAVNSIEFTDATSEDVQSIKDSLYTLLNLGD